MVHPIKGSETWKCLKCYSKQTQLYRAFGSWPIPAFNSLDNEVKATFAKEVANIQGTDKLKEWGYPLDLL